MNKSSHTFNKNSASLIAVITALLLAISKAVVGFLSGSLSIITSALDSIFDSIVSAMNYILIRKSDAPADKGHPFGHGKLEAYASLMQSIIIFTIGCYILLEAFKRIQNKEMPSIHTSAFIVMMVAICASYFISEMLRKVAERESSPALYADSIHYTIDLISNTGVLLSLILIKMIGFYWIDPLIASIISFYIMVAAVKLHISSLKILLDSRAPDEYVDKIRAALDKFKPYSIDYHRLRTRTDGSVIFADVHITLCDRLTLEDSHTLCDLIEIELMKEFRNLDITIHPEPCSLACDDWSTKKIAVQEFISKSKHLVPENFSEDDRIKDE